MPQEHKRVLDCTATDNVYLHKDFHGGLCYSIKYLDETYGPKATAEYLRQVGRTVWAPLIAQMKHQGLPALEKHWQKVFSQEGGDFSLTRDDGTLVLTVRRCPAVAHLKNMDMFFTDRFCQTTVLVNETMCRQAGLRCSCDYEPGQGRCVQRFWRQDT